MRYLMKIGPIEFQHEASSTAYLAVGEEGIDTVFSNSDNAGIEQLLRRSREEATCEPALQKAARRHGLQIGQPIREALALKLGLAVALEHGTMLKFHNLPLLIELAEAFAAFVRAEPWTKVEGDNALTVELDRPSRTWEACVMGQNGETFGLALYHQSGSMERLHELSHLGRDEEIMTLPSTSVVIGEEPPFVVDAMQEFTGLAISPMLMQVRNGKMVELTEADVAATVAAVRAVTGLVVGQPATGTAQESKSRTTARVSPRQIGRPETSIDTSAGVARNDPCPCGSGKKFKQCHLGSQAPTGPGQSWHERDHRLIDQLLAFSRQHFGHEATKRMGPETFGGQPAPVALVAPLATYEWPTEGKPVAAHFLGKQRVLDVADRQWLEAQLAARLGIWEVLRVDHGQGLDLVNLLTGERKHVREQRGSQTLVTRDVVLARVVDAPDMSLLGGNHEAPLTPREADAVVQKARAELTEPGWKTTVRLLELWGAALSERERRLATPMRVRNTDGHEATMVEDQFTVSKGKFASALSRLSALQGVSLSGQDGRGAHLTFTLTGNAIHSTWQNTIIGSARMTSTRLTLSTNSVERADALKQHVSEALIGIAKFKKRAEQILPPVPGGQDMMIDAQSVSSPSTAEAYRAWLDTEIPLLGGRTPRAAVSDPEARPMVHLFLKEMENAEARKPDSAGPDAKQMRRELGLNELGEPLEHHDLNRAVGSGRRISETLLEFARPLLGEGSSSEHHLQSALRFATLVWNVVVAEERKWPAAAMADLNRQLAPGKFPLELMKHFDLLTTRKRERFAGDLRMVGEWRLKRSSGAIGVEMEAMLPPDLIERAKAAGVRP